MLNSYVKIKIETIIFIFFPKEETITFWLCKIKEICMTEWECLCLEHGRMPHFCAFTSIFKKEQRKQNALAYSIIGLYHFFYSLKGLRFVNLYPKIFFFIKIIIRRRTKNEEGRIVIRLSLFLFFFINLWNHY